MKVKMKRIFVGLLFALAFGLNGTFEYFAGQKRGREVGLSTEVSQQNKKRFKCDECEKSFARNAYLTEHKRVHTGERPFKCDKCEKSFTRNAYLTNHKIKHLEEWPFKCDECEKSFTRNGDLTIHKRKHAGKRPFVCDKCRKGFLQHSHLTEHKRVHKNIENDDCFMVEEGLQDKDRVSVLGEASVSNFSYQDRYFDNYP